MIGLMIDIILKQKPTCDSTKRIPHNRSRSLVSFVLITIANLSIHFLYTQDTSHSQPREMVDLTNCFEFAFE